MAMQWYFMLVMESQHGGGWKGPLEIIQSTSLAQAGFPKAGCPGP